MKSKIITRFNSKLILQKNFTEGNLFMRKNCNKYSSSFLPYYRGPVPTAWAILNGEKFWCSIHKITEGIDSGDIYVQKSFKIKPLETGYELHNRAMKRK